ncbi:2-succinyl-5-enolpyruvyl-6-hydroxy-3-cyclohexene-1-carboxylic-acid synthase [Kurthia sibirica]|uniref:2-succinyl-5-enolpyruvyl-6-hydroxy-3-cyclohexene-1-carboxylate synthase n=1 Tax=Kurthia sibirica TaxID=202750 RepID=A0A2U3AJU2_9BACL|nr:2-succinyl-5-enolpyruvyl-6-hydroxy-3-cyclohexene-1-carboxylic-acid synthase [Kurthia sibirica]PWI24800.1 2-succinyl-5-enolpyruvyl-6-hydroxy-3-cyclohexene-1-carboxylic-acid synthase [Kurthia sibirica]GEK35578.1 2-succinyl-5-enolpyruvyl-6-hydroxy-3-cyclohexene-1-carboxylate synthase [Kurthia sibirica]
MTTNRILTDYVYELIGALHSAGVVDVVISPGSRSTALAYAFASSKEFKIVRHVDERSAAFLALGIAKTKAAPVVLLCTSGTAAANYFPAIIEAYYARVPLIVLTADRPHELRGVGAPQAINQPNLYGHHVKMTVDLPIPDNDLHTLPYIARQMTRVTTMAMDNPRGPVHVNIPFREPLLIDFQEQLPPARMEVVFPADVAPSAATLAAFKTQIEATKKGFIVIGDLPQHVDLRYLWAFIRQLKWPVLVESLSHLRTNIPADCADFVIDHYDAILKNEQFKHRMAPQTVIRFGAQPVSKPLTLFLKAVRPEYFIVIDEDAIFRDPVGIVTMHIHAPVDKWLTSFTSANEIFDKDYCSKWLAANTIATTKITNYIASEEDEGAIAGLFFTMMPDGSDLIVSSSMPIRDVDTFFTKTTRNIHVYANRGTNGIDGVVSTAIGTQLASGRQSYLLIGDLAFLHDSNGLIASRYQAVDLTIIVMNNDGGGIFSYLAQASVEKHYETLFGTPTGLQFNHLAAMYDAQYDAVDSKEQFATVFSQPKVKPLRIIEVATNRQANVLAHRMLWQQINEELETIW